MISMEGSSSGIMHTLASLWKYVNKVEKFEKGGDESVFIAFKHLMDHTQESRPISRI